MVLDLAWAQSRYIRKVVIATIERGDDPAREDLAAALEDIPGEPIPRVLIDYVRRAYVLGTPRRTGPVAGRNTKVRDNLVRSFYRMVERELRQSEQSNEVKRLAVHQTAVVHRISTRTVQRIISADASLKHR